MKRFSSIDVKYLLFKYFVHSKDIEFQKKHIQSLKVLFQRVHYKMFIHLKKHEKKPNAGGEGSASERITDEPAPV